MEALLKKKQTKDNPKISARLAIAFVSGFVLATALCFTASCIIIGVYFN